MSIIKYIRLKLKLIDVLVFIMILVVILGFIFSIIYSVKYSEEFGNIFTILSGWISGFSTIFAIIVASIIAKITIDKNKDFNNQQIINSIKVKEYDMMIYKHQLYIDGIIKFTELDSELCQRYRDKLDKIDLSDMNDIINLFTQYKSDVLDLYNSYKHYIYATEFKDTNDLIAGIANSIEMYRKSAEEIISDLKKGQNPHYYFEDSKRLLYFYQVSMSTHYQQQENEKLEEIKSNIFPK